MLPYTYANLVHQSCYVLPGTTVLRYYGIHKHGDQSCCFNMSYTRYVYTWYRYLTVKKDKKKLPL